MKSMSSYEAAVCKILQKEKIFFEREKNYKDLHYGYYRFDFYLPQHNILIEVDGEQHFKYTKRFYKKKEDFKKAQERDRLKNSYALSHKISLYRIPYWKIEQIKSIKDIICDENLVKSKWHNDELRVPKN